MEELKTIQQIIPDKQNQITNNHHHYNNSRNNHLNNHNNQNYNNNNNINNNNQHQQQQQHNHQQEQNLQQQPQNQSSSTIHNSISTSNNNSTDLKYLHKKFKRIASATVDCVDNFYNNTTKSTSSSSSASSLTSLQNEIVITPKVLKECPSIVSQTNCSSIVVVNSKNNTNNYGGGGGSSRLESQQKPSPPSTLSAVPFQNNTLLQQQQQQQQHLVRIDALQQNHLNYNQNNEPLRLHSSNNNVKYENIEIIDNNFKLQQQSKISANKQPSINTNSSSFPNKISFGVYNHHHTQQPQQQSPLPNPYSQTTSCIVNNINSNYNQTNILNNLNSAVLISSSPNDRQSIKQESTDQRPLYNNNNNSVQLPPQPIGSGSGSGGGELVPQTPGRYVCPYCQLNCTKPSVLQKHIRAHTNERPYPCVPCGFAFKTRSNLYKHCRLVDLFFHYYLIEQILINLIFYFFLDQGLMHYVHKVSIIIQMMKFLMDLIQIKI